MCYYLVLANKTFDGIQVTVHSRIIHEQCFQLFQSYQELSQCIFKLSGFGMLILECSLLVSNLKIIK